MSKKAFADINIVIDMGYGDSGKGTIVDFMTGEIMRSGKEVMNVRFSGGPQCGHNVIHKAGTPDFPDEHHTFSQFGAGTLNGDTVITHYGKDALLDPLAWQKEAVHLATMGYTEAPAKFTADPNCFILHEIHGAANRVKETLRGTTRHGSCGRGIGEAGFVLEECDPKYHIFLKTLHTSKKSEVVTILTDLVLLYRDVVFGNKQDDIRQFRNEGLLSLQDSMLFSKDTTLTDLDARVNVIAEDMEKGIHGLCMQSDKDALVAAREKGMSLVFEGSQGVLIDRRVGFFPHVTRSDVTSRLALRMLDEAGLLNSDIKVTGVTRTYMARHGSGPLPSYNALYTEKLSDKYNPVNPWQGQMRCGYLDIPMLQYAFNRMTTLKRCEIAVTHLDAKIDGAVPEILTEYQEMTDDPNAWQVKKTSAAPKDISMIEHANHIAHLIGCCDASILSFGPTNQDKELR